MKGGAAVADGDRPIVLVPLATARRAARRAGVTLNLSAEDIALAGKWKHGWIPLDAVASAVKAKRYHGGATHELKTHSGPVHVRNVRDDANNKNMAIATVVKDHRKGTASSHAPGESVWVAKAQVHPLGPPSKGRAGSAVESRREPSRGRTKSRPPASGGQAAKANSDASRLPNGEKMGGPNDHLASLGQRNAIFRAQGLPEQEPGESKASHGKRVAKVIDERGRKAHAEYSARQRQSADRLLSTAPGATGEAARARLGQVSVGPRREPHVSAEPMKDGRHKLTDAKSGESVKAVHLASFHNQGHTITGVRNGQMHTRDDYGKAHVYDPATGRAATASASLADHARAHPDASLRDLTSRFSKGTAEGRAVRAEIARRAKRGGATGRAQQVAQDRTRRLEAARGEPKLADLSESDLRGLISRYGEKSVQADAARAEMARRSGQAETPVAELQPGDQFVREVSTLKRGKTRVVTYTVTGHSERKGRKHLLVRSTYQGDGSFAHDELPSVTVLRKGGK